MALRVQFCPSLSAVAGYEAAESQAPPSLLMLGAARTANTLKRADERYNNSEFPWSIHDSIFSVVRDS